MTEPEYVRSYEAEIRALREQVASLTAALADLVEAVAGVSSGGRIALRAPIPAALVAARAALEES